MYLVFSQYLGVRFHLTILHVVKKLLIIVQDPSFAFDYQVDLINLLISKHSLTSQYFFYCQSLCKIQFVVITELPRYIRLLHKPEVTNYVYKFSIVCRLWKICLAREFVENFKVDFLSNKTLWLTFYGFLFSLSVALLTLPVGKLKFMSFKYSSLHFYCFFLSFRSGKKYLKRMHSAIDFAILLPLSVINYCLATSLLKTSSAFSPAL